MSFFRDQANFLEKNIFDKFTFNELRKHQIRCGTPFSFQGEERDIMLISCCVDENTSASAYNYLNRNDVFNVAITRARTLQKVFLSCALEHINNQSLLKRYIQYCETLSLKQKNNVAHDKYQNEVCALLEEQGVTVFKNYSVAGEMIDILATYHDRSIAIDLIGYIGELKGALPLKKYQLLNRAGLVSVLFPYREWLEKSDDLINLVLGKLDVQAKEIVAEEKRKAIFSSEEVEEFMPLIGISLNALHKKLSDNELIKAQRQLEAFVEKYKDFTELLPTKFFPEEVTYYRYLNAYQNLMCS